MGSARGQRLCLANRLIHHPGKLNGVSCDLCRTTRAGAPGDNENKPSPKPRRKEQYCFPRANVPLCGANQSHGLWPWSISLSLQILAPAALVSVRADDRKMCKIRTTLPPNKPSPRISSRLPLASPFLHLCTRAGDRWPIRWTCQAGRIET